MNQKITVIDSIMGSGKTTWAINYINNHPEKNFLYVTPLLSEIDRVINKTKWIMWQPDNRKKTKLADIKDIIIKNVNIGTTHALFQSFDKECVELFRQNEYVLILDETLDIINELPYKKKDIELLEKSGCIEEGENFVLEWIDKDEDQFYIKDLKDLEVMIKTGKVIKIGNHKLLWQFPPYIFDLFSETYVLTYLFESSMLYYYFTLNSISFIKKSIKDDKLVDFFKAPTTQYRKYINIYQGQMNSNYEKPDEYALSKRYFQRHPKTVYQMKKNIYNFFRWNTDSSSNERMWTTYKIFKNKMKGDGYTKGFVACNSRATNDYSHKTALAYCVNFFMKPIIVDYFNSLGVEIDQGLYALGNLLQWIWRSNVRTCGTISVYIPSLRMRTLLYAWMGYPQNEIKRLEKLSRK